MNTTFVKCVDFTFDGQGLAKTNSNRVVFVPSLLIGEEAEVEILYRKKDFDVGKIVKLIKKSVKVEQGIVEIAKIHMKNINKYLPNGNIENTLSAKVFGVTTFWYIPLATNIIPVIVIFTQSHKNIASD